jgi:divalent metal cation (Fe/Co/Zn/Cd) transporter
MELVEPNVGLIVWTILYLACFGLTIVAVIRLVQNNELEMLAKLFWATLIVFVPVIGPIIYIFRNKIRKQNSAV